MRNKYFICLIAILSFKYANSQVCYQRLLSSLSIEAKVPFYVDSAKNYYGKYRTTGVAYDIDFRKVERLAETDKFYVEGRLFAPKTDTFGIDGIYFFLAKLKADTIIKIRPLGYSSDEKDKYGFFEFETEIESDDFLFFCYPDFSSLRQFQIGELLQRKLNCSGYSLGKERVNVPSSSLLPNLLQRAQRIRL